MVQFFRVVTEYFNSQISAGTGEHFIYPHLNGLGKGIVNTGEPGFQYLTNCRYQFFLALHVPFLSGFEHQEGIGIIKPHRIHADFIRTHTGHHTGDFRYFF